MVKSTQSLLEKRQARKRILLIAVGILLVICIWSGVNYVHTDSFCVTCHSMVQFKQSIARNVGHAEVPCIECHLPQDGSNRQLALAGLILRDLKATMKDEENYHLHSFVPDANCMRADCHSGDTLDLDMTRRANTAFMEFRHTPHFERLLPGETPLLCTTCHAHNHRLTPPKHSTHFTVYTETCFACHSMKVTSMEVTGVKELNQPCLICHPRDSLTPDKPGHTLTGKGWQKPNRKRNVQILLDEIACEACHHMYARKLEPVEANACAKCHPDEEDAEWDPALNLHVVHVPEKRGDCIDCHKPSPHGKTIAKLFDKSDCEGCHERSLNQFKDQLAMYQGIFDIMNIPDPMAKAGINCGSCHTRSGYACSDGRDSCTNCHVAGYEKLVDIWQETIQAKLEQVQALYDQAIREGRLEEIPARTKRYLDYIIEDGSWGVHNIALTQYILLVCATPIVAPQPPPPSDPPPSKESE